MKANELSSPSPPVRRWVDAAVPGDVRVPQPRDAPSTGHSDVAGRGPDGGERKTKRVGELLFRSTILTEAGDRLGRMINRDIWSQCIQHSIYHRSPCCPVTRDGPGPFRSGCLHPRRSSSSSPGTCGYWISPPALVCPPMHPSPTLSLLYSSQRQAGRSTRVEPTSEPPLAIVTAVNARNAVATKKCHGRCLEGGWRTTCSPPVRSARRTKAGQDGGNCWLGLPCLPMCSAVQPGLQSATGQAIGTANQRLGSAAFPSTSRGRAGQATDPSSALCCDSAHFYWK
jgi:hypothetical protein